MAEWRYQIKDLRLKAAGHAGGLPTAPHDHFGAAASFFSSPLGFIIFLIGVLALDIGVWGLSGFSKSSAQDVYARITPGAAVFYFYCKWLAHRKIRLAKFRDEHERS